ncbi:MULTISPECIES: MTH1187 family thiamine-binding protein [unclassified Fusibacter]|uniref:MTH1187 family thiamine-binding protein n=1 Tax=unclassified Fusibacter TaxID=2624464 RepID=UPI001010A257|nr:MULTISPECIES: MTH1187 family thiamine-binding protein [unclassified Fusibacter]MCK8061097.1 MTH1187 family thiamine-binding protein [Fusibacter sp. A2]NPE23367.1 MTH1187 family thiamine-binding protein [Fusibacter sp. A1]RXV59412.1 thiamine-binding protein [Fusibacter sp. A1]
MAVVEVTIVPLGTADTSVSKYVADCHRIVTEQSEIKYLLTPMATVLEGDLATIMELIAKMHEVPFASGAKRVSTSIKIDDRRDKIGTIDQKLKSVEEKL